MKTPLGTLTEDRLTSLLANQLRQPSSDTIGIGDDCALLSNGTLLKTDCIVEGQHYLPHTSPQLIGRKAVNRVLSDFAAMGGWPTHLLITIGLRQSSFLEDVLELYKGMEEALTPYGCTIVGGETVIVDPSDKEFISVSGTGQLNTSTPILRSGAKVGDLIYVSGALGNSFHSEHHLTFTPRLMESLWLSKHVNVSAMMDLSDGIARDLPRLTTLSNVGYTLDLNNLPLRAGADTKAALEEGEDYELLFTLPSEESPNLRKAPFPFYQIGSITKNTPIPLSGGWDHLERTT